MGTTGYNAYNTIWSAWNDTSDTSTSANTVWGAWNMSTDGTNATVWTYWNTTTANVIVYDNQYDNQIWTSWQEIPSYTYTDPVKVKKTRSQRKAINRQKQRLLKAELKRKRKLALVAQQKRQAELKAQELLFDLLGEKQTEVFRRTGRLFVQGEKFGWLISMLGEGETAWVNIKKLKENKIIDLCVRIDDPVPPSDKVISFALRAKFDEESFNKTANHTRVSDKSKLEECANF